MSIEKAFVWQIFVRKADLWFGR